MGNNRLLWMSCWLGCILFLMACDPGRVYEKNEPVAVNGWNYADSREFTVLIPDTLAAYNVFINIRHTTDYDYNNLWIKMQTLLPDSTVLYDKVELSLADPDGTWHGNCLDGICYTTVLIRSNVHFPLAGYHTFRILQDMRVDPLPDILDVGIRVERMNL